MTFKIVEQAAKVSAKSDFINEQKRTDFGKSAKKAFNIFTCHMPHSLCLVHHVANSYSDEATQIAWACETFHQLRRIGACTYVCSCVCICNTHQPIEINLVKRTHTYI